MDKDKEIAALRADLRRLAGAFANLADHIEKDAIGIPNRDATLESLAKAAARAAKTAKGIAEGK